MRHFIILAASLALVGCQSRDSFLAKIVVDELKAELRDPDSLQLTDTEIVIAAGRGAICGSYNAKNAYGGLAGPRLFVRVFDQEDMATLDRLVGETGGSKTFAVSMAVRENSDRLAREAAPAGTVSRSRGLFMQGIDFETTSMAIQHCGMNARPITLRP